MAQKFRFNFWAIYKPKKTALETIAEKAYQYYRTLTPKQQKQFIHNLKNLK